MIPLCLDCINYEYGVCVVNWKKKLPVYECKDFYEFEGLNYVEFITGYPYCSRHGAMNKVSKYGMWRCLMCHIGYNETTKEFYRSSSEGFRKRVK